MFFEKGKASYVGKQSLLVDHKKNSKSQNVSIMSWKFVHMQELMDARIQDPEFSIIDHIEFRSQSAHTKHKEVKHKDYLGWIDTLEDLPPKEIEQLIFFIENEFENYVQTKIQNSLTRLPVLADLSLKLIENNSTTLLTKKTTNEINELLNKMRCIIK
ncbi:hypothetical protein [Photobacterium kishitanii]|uniref:Uncharacterized protein n=1 Tax=Photobacterium kishitanii TaxID=318456 RepID=A0A2T3KM08_9GAMM|nr:hypothetical protein [Photobacterium kishitanii]PSV00713.1 hypothetical protein C9J27_06110 [Photobacterium kishitanii]